VWFQLTKELGALQSSYNQQLRKGEALWNTVTKLAPKVIAFFSLACVTCCLLSVIGGKCVTSSPKIPNSLLSNHTLCKILSLCLISFLKFRLWTWFFFLLVTFSVFCLFGYSYIFLEMLVSTMLHLYWRCCCSQVRHRWSCAAFHSQRRVKSPPEKRWISPTSGYCTSMPSLCSLLVRDGEQLQ